MKTHVFRFGLALLLSGLLSACVGTTDAPDDLVDGPSDEVGESEDADSLEAELGKSEAALFVPKKNMRIAVIGAGPSGLMAARTLKERGYRNVTVFEKNDRVGGKVYSIPVPQTGDIAELGAVFASPDYKIVLGLADQYGIPYGAYGGTQKILADGQKYESQEFLTSRYDLLKIAAAVASYAGVQVLYAQINQNGLDWLLPDAKLPFSEFAKKYNLEPITELVRSVMVGFGYGYYEDVPAMYFLKLMFWLVKLAPPPTMLESAQYYTFPTGFQSVWKAVAADLDDVRLNSEVTAVKRTTTLLGLGPTQVELTINGRQKEKFDAVIVSAPLNRVGEFMDLSNAERELFSHVDSLRYVVTLFGAANMPAGEALFFHDFARPSGINHVNVWANRSGGVSMIAYQIADRKLSLAQIAGVLQQDVADQGGTFLALALQQEWQDYFPHVKASSFKKEPFFYEKVEALQGVKNTFYVGGTLSFETVEHSARYAKELVEKNFPR